MILGDGDPILLLHAFGGSLYTWRHLRDDKISRGTIEEYARALREPGGKYALMQVAGQVVPSRIDSLTSLYPRLDVPTLVVWGRDEECPEDLAPLIRAFLRSTGS